MNLELTEEQKLIQDTAREFAAAELEPLAAGYDRGEDLQPFYDNLTKLAELGFMGLNVKGGVRRYRGRSGRLQCCSHRDRPRLCFYGSHRLSQQHGLRSDPGDWQ